MNDFEKIKSLELELVDPKARGNNARMNELISDDFEEFGSSGMVFHKRDVLSWFTKGNHPNYELSNFKYRELSAHCILVTYESVVSDTRALRSSIWKKENGGWQMLHHQSTVVPSGI